MTKSQLQDSPGRQIRQARSRRTYDALVASGFRLLEKVEFEDITIAGLSEAAGYSVGAFYARFESKDEFFSAMVAKHIEVRTRARNELLETASHEELIGRWIEDLVRYYWKHRGFWRAVLMRSTNDPDFWAPVDRNGREFVQRLTARIQTDLGRELTKTESTHIRFAIHMILSMVNNRIVNRPRPSLIGHSTFVENLTRAFRLVSGYDSLDS